MCMRTPSYSMFVVLFSIVVSFSIQSVISLGQAPEKYKPNWHCRANTLPMILVDKWCHLVLHCVDTEVVMGVRVKQIAWQQ